MEVSKPKGDDAKSRIAQRVAGANPEIKVIKTSALNMRITHEAVQAHAVAAKPYSLRLEAFARKYRNTAQ